MEFPLRRPGNKELQSSKYIQCTYARLNVSIYPFIEEPRDKCYHILHRNREIKYTCQKLFNQCISYLPGTVEPAGDAVQHSVKLHWGGQLS